MLLLSFAGISLGVMTTSLEEEEEGSLLGTEQLSKNINIMKGVQDASRIEAEADTFAEEVAAEGIVMTQAELDAKKRRGGM